MITKLKIVVLWIIYWLLTIPERIEYWNDCDSNINQSEDESGEFGAGAINEAEPIPQRKYSTWKEFSTDFKEFLK